MATVLLVDDDVDLQEVNQFVLEKGGYDVRLAYSAAEAEEAIKAGRPDVVVLDVMMESVDAGFGAARSMRQAYPDLPILMLTGINTEMPFAFDFSGDATYAPVTKFVEKPIPPDTLLAEVEALIRAKDEA